MGKVNSKYALIALSSIFALSMFGCTKTSDTSEMGRYIEEFYDAPEGIYDVRDLRVLADGTIGMLAYGENEIELYISEDACKSWNRKDINLPQGDSENDMLSVNNAILSKDGEIFISYCFYDYTEYEEGENLKEEAVDDSAEESEDAVEDDKYYEPEYKYAFIDTDEKVGTNKTTALFKEAVLSIKPVNNMVVLKTVKGTASMVSGFLDKLALDDMLGCVFGEDTVMALFDVNVSIDSVVFRINEVLTGS